LARIDPIEFIACCRAYGVGLAGIGAVPGGRRELCDGSWMIYRSVEGKIKSMSSHAITLDEGHFRAAQEQARAMGKTPEQYLQTLIEAASQTFDEILLPVRQGFDGMSDAEIEALFNRAKKAARGQSK
jgi:hypothetical protein